MSLSDMDDVKDKTLKGGCKAKFLGKILYVLYGFYRGRRYRGLIRYLLLKREKGPFYSVTLRQIFRDYHQVSIGMYTQGSCFELNNFDRHTIVGRYCSIAANVKVFNRNHPMDFKSMHGFFFNPILKYTKEDLVKYTPLVIGNDVWIGDSVKIMAQVTNIGDGAVIGAGSVITKNIPPYAVAVGYPARIVRYRFSVEVIEKLLEEKWWKKDIEQIKPNIKEYQQNYENLHFDKKKTDFAEKNDARSDDS